MHDLLYIIPRADRSPDRVRKHLEAHQEIRFVSFSGVDLGGNDTDERIPVSTFLANIDNLLVEGVQTDGSSVVLPGIATLNDGGVDIIPDPEVSWYVDYNHEFIDPLHGHPIGTLRIPSFLKHGDRFVGSRAILKGTMESCERRIMSLLREYPRVAELVGIDPPQIACLDFTVATELEFWVQTPGNRVETEKLAVSQLLQESYWKRTKGSVRTALELSLILLESYDLSPEMGHKEVGGVKATISDQGGLSGIMEQLEIDWRFSGALQAADNELLARILIKETFRRHGLEVTFMAKPLNMVAGSGEHTHVNIMANMRDGSRKNLFAPIDMSQDYLSPLGWGALMGLLRNYEAVNAFVSSSNDSFNRLKPGFEAPVCIVASIGAAPTLPSRNRTVLAGVLREIDKPLGTRFEVRAPNPHTNTYLAVAAFYQAMLDGMQWAAGSGRSSRELQEDFCKSPGTPHAYLETDRAYRSEEDVFEHYSQEERDAMFGTPPATVWQSMANLEKYPEKTAVLMTDEVFAADVIDSYREAMLLRSTMGLSSRVIPDSLEEVRGCRRLEGENPLDARRWADIQTLKSELARDDPDQLSLFSQIRDAVVARDYAKVSDLQLVMGRKMEDLRSRYLVYKRNVEVS